MILLLTQGNWQSEAPNFKNSFCLIGANLRGIRQPSGWLQLFQSARERSVMMVSVGNKYYIETEHVVEILQAGDLLAERLTQSAESCGRLIDATGGRRTRSLIRLKSKHVVLTALRVKTLNSRFGGGGPAAAAGKSVKARPGHPQKLHPSKPWELDDRRREPDRRHFSYTFYVPERRSGTDRRSSPGKPKRKRNT